jgi:hypothetical protein
VGLWFPCYDLSCSRDEEFVRVYTQVVWWATNALLGALLYRGVRERLAREYPVFYSYLAFVLCKSFVLFRLSFVSRQSYAIGYWAAELLATLLGVGVMWELYDVVLAPYHGVRRMGRALITTLLAVLFLKFAIDVAARPFTVLMPTTVELQRNLRFMQALLMVAIFMVLRYYRVVLGRNAGYLFIGYAIVVSTSVINLTLRSALGAPFQRWWTIFGPVEYLITVGCWCVGLWSRSSNPAPSPSLAQDYATVSRQTAMGMARLRSRLVGAFR